MNTSSIGQARLTPPDSAGPESLQEARENALRRGTWILAVGAGTRLESTAHPVRWESQHPGETGRVQFSPADLVVTVEAGMTLGDLARLLKDARQWLPLGLPHEAQDTVGGAVSAGLDGYWRGRYGPLRDRMLAVTIWTPGFGVTRLGAPVVKNVAGYNLARLSWGTGGAFGIVLDATFKLEPLPASSVCWDIVYATGDRAEAFRLGQQLTRQEETLCLLMLQQEEESVRVTVGWQGRGRRPAALREMLGTPGREGPAPIAFSEAGTLRERWQGALPLAALEETWQQASHRTSGLVLDLLSGGVWADNPTEDFLAGVVNRGGSLRRQTSGGGGIRVGDSILAETLARYKGEMDPLGLLRPVVGPAEEVTP